MKQWRMFIAAIFLFGVLALAGCGSSTPEPPKKDTSEKPKSVSEERQQGLKEDARVAPVEEKAVDVSNEALLKELAALERKWIQEDLHQLVVKCDTATDSWLHEEKIYNQYIFELSALKNDFDKYYADTKKIYDQKGFASKLKDEPRYTKGLIYGQKMRDNVKEFFDTTFVGVKDSQGKIIDLSGDKYRDFYYEKMVKQYNDDYRKINALLNK